MKNSDSGTICTPDRNKKLRRHALKVDEICALIKQCSESGVTEITFGELHISFASKAIEALPEQAIAGTEPEKIEQDLERKEIEDKEDLLAHMLVEDPVAYERLRLAGELEDGHSRTESAL